EVHVVSGSSPPGVVPEVSGIVTRLVLAVVGTLMHHTQDRMRSCLLVHGAFDHTPDLRYRESNERLTFLEGTLAYRVCTASPARIELEGRFPISCTLHDLHQDIVTPEFLGIVRTSRHV